MHALRPRPLRPVQPPGSTLCDTPRRGLLVRIDPDGSPFVDFSGNPRAEPVQARSLLGSTRASGAQEGAEVLLAFEDGDPHHPVILGVLHSTLAPHAEDPEPMSPAKPCAAVLVDGQRVLLEARRELVLRCGETSIVLTHDGRLLLRGRHITSRAIATQRMLGAVIKLN